MKKAMLFLMISGGCLWGCANHDPSSGEPEVVAPVIGYVTVDSVLAYNRHVSLDIDSDAKTDLYFTSALFEENDELCLYLNARAVGGSGTSILIGENPELISGGRWAYPLAGGAKIGEATDVNAAWSAPAQHGSILRIVEGPVPQFSGPWLGKTDHYIGFRKLTDGREQYGWVRISHEWGTKQLIVQDMGMMLVPEKEIAAGQKSIF
jgi:hypothetical protein